MARVTAPVKGFTGNGPAGIEFADGAAETDNPGALAYFRAAGYGIDDEAPEPVVEPEQPDARDIVPVVHIGTPTPDATVAPQPKAKRSPAKRPAPEPEAEPVVEPAPEAGLEPGQE